MILTPTAQQLDELLAPQPRPAVEQLLDPAAGTIAIGQRTDGDPARLPIWTEHGAVHLGVVGRAGAGASVLLTHLWAAEAPSPLLRSWAAGAPDFDEQHLGEQHLDRTATTPGQTRALLAEAVELAHARHTAASNWPGLYQPTEAEPLITLTLTRWDLVRADAASVRHVEGLALLGRRAGIGLRVTYPGHYLDALGTVLSRALAGGALVALHGSAIGGVAGGAQAAIPFDLPGTGYLLTRRQSPALFRTWAPAAVAA